MAVVAAVALVQWLVDIRVLADVALLVALYTVAVHERPSRIVASTVVVEAGVAMATIRWSPGGDEPRSFVFLTGLVAAAVCGGLAVRSGSQYLGWMDERAARLELERDQQAAISAAEERARIAREMHDIVAHSLSVVITLADAASVTPDPDDAAAAIRQVADVGREALQDMRVVLAALRTEETADLGPLPGLDDLDSLYRQVRRTGLVVEPTVVGDVPDLSAALELSIYRIVQEALTNTLKHAGASTVDVRIEYGPAHGHRASPRRRDRLRAGRQRPRADGDDRTGGDARRPAVGRTVVGRGLARDGIAAGRPVTIRVVLVDDQPLLRQGFRMILEAESDIEVIAEAGDGATAAELAATYHPDVVLMDVRMPGSTASRARGGSSPTRRTSECSC